MTGEQAKEGGVALSLQRECNHGANLTWAPAN